MPTTNKYTQCWNQGNTHVLLCKQELIQTQVKFHVYYSAIFYLTMTKFSFTNNTNLQFSKTLFKLSDQTTKRITATFSLMYSFFPQVLVSFHFKTNSSASILLSLFDLFRVGFVNSLNAKVAI